MSMGGSVHSFEIEVDKTELVRTLKLNRAKHVKIYAEAKERYLEACIAAVRERLDTLEKVSAGEAEMKQERFLRFHAPNDKRKDLLNSCPRSYADVYDEVLEMLSYHKPDSIVLTNRQFRAWVKDEWDWKDLFIGTTASY
jgi:hypothetical protein